MPKTKTKPTKKIAAEPTAPRHQLARLSDFLDDLVRERDNAYAEIAKWRDTFDQRPEHALVWSTQVFSAVAAKGVYEYVLEALSFGHSTVEIRKWLVREILHKSKYPPRTSSPTSNLWEQEVTAAKADFLDKRYKFGVEVTDAKDS